MNELSFAFDEQQQAVRELAARILDDKVTPDSLRTIEDGDRWLHDNAWQAFREAQLVTIALPEEHGGGGLGVLELCIMAEEIGRHVAPVPVLEHALAVSAIAQSGNRATATRHADMLSVESIATLALAEDGAWLADELATKATPDQNGWTLSGRKTTVPFASVAGRFIVSAQTSEGPGLFVVASDAPGLTLTHARITTEERAAHLELDAVTVNDADFLGCETFDWLIPRYEIGLVAMASGIAQQALKLTADYARERRQFDVPICTFQAVAQRAADAFIQVEALQLALWQAAWRLHAGLDAERELRVARYWAAEAGYFVVAAGQHIHGGMGFDRDYPLFRYYLWHRRLETLLGGANAQLERLGDLLADDDAIADHF